MDKAGCEGTSFLEGLQIHTEKYRVLAFTGGGGKTGLIFRLSEELTALGKKVIVTTTTHMAFEPERPFAENGDPEQISRNLEKYGYTLAARTDWKIGKLCGLAGECLESLKEECDVLLIEADGSKRLPLKVPETWEPVIPDFADAVVGVAGLDALGRPIRETAHRPELTAAFLGKRMEDTVTEEDIVKIASSEKALRKNIGNRLCRVYLNKADVLSSPEKAEYICRELEKFGIYGAYGSLSQSWIKKVSVHCGSGRIGEKELKWK